MDVCIYWQLKSHIYHHLSLSVTWISLSDLVVEINRKKILNWASQKVYFGDCLGMFPCITIILSVVPWVLVCSQIHSKGRYAGCSITSARAVAHHTRLTQTLQIELRDAKEQVEIDKDAIPSQGVTNLLSELIKPLYRLRSRQFAFSCVFVLPGRFLVHLQKKTHVEENLEIRNNSDSRVKVPVQVIETQHAVWHPTSPQLQFGHANWYGQLSITSIQLGFEIMSLHLRTGTMQWPCTPRWFERKLVNLQWHS